ncbi:hypothetical protein B0H11DRAFT_2107144 [Mycena galericulata]|nr:hypothetical protein B0H11DRAFT_2107144 [Mycena galericulata]
MTSYTPPSNPSPTHQAFLAFVDAIQAKDHAAIMACYDDSAEVSILPGSLGQPKVDKPTYSESFGKGLANFKHLKLTLYEVIEAGSVFTVHAASKGESVSGTPWANEYIFILHFTAPKAGGLPKIVSLKEFVDSAAVAKFFSEDAAAAAKSS